MKFDLNLSWLKKPLIILCLQFYLILMTQRLYQDM